MSDARSTATLHSHAHSHCVTVTACHSAKWSVYASFDPLVTSSAINLCRHVEGPGGCWYFARAACTHASTVIVRSALVQQFLWRCSVLQVPTVGPTNDVHMVALHACKTTMCASWCMHTLPQDEHSVHIASVHVRGKRRTCAFAKAAVNALPAPNSGSHAASAASASVARASSCVTLPWAALTSCASAVRSLFACCNCVFVVASVACASPSSALHAVEGCEAGTCRASALCCRLIYMIQRLGRHVSSMMQAALSPASARIAPHGGLRFSQLLELRLQLGTRGGGFRTRVHRSFVRHLLGGQLLAALCQLAGLLVYLALRFVAEVLHQRRVVLACGALHS